ncbi:Signal peptidase IB [Acaryochloris thomasi RCC1774]|uniref:Signal peptidase I n=1 Tax=Acaryochloris thomasi RCC1774 TaxID=1764569 RepID=A0A2W1JPS1_9CYAN|nr:signal peptidase I [Acaryochloris thomasi]PZD75309.1 Signal peptidase IB [Acaryochloris thomasi RCC1774]
MAQQPQRPPLSSATPETAIDESWWLDLFKTIALSLFLAFGIRTFVAEARYVPTGSMKPTIAINDRLIVDKVTFRLRQPVRGDIIVFKPTAALREQGYSDTFVKRIVGLPGDRIEIKEGAVFINGTQLQEGYVANGDQTFTDLCHSGKTIPATAFLDQPRAIPANSYLVLGDNRHNSHDGRCWGLVSSQELVGRAMLRYWPLNRFSSL